MRFERTLKTVRGFTIVEILLTVGILGVVSAGVLSFSSWAIKSVQSETLKADRNVENLEMLKLVTDPVYFGSLSLFPENKQLASCLTVDEVLCDSLVSYGLTAFDLATKQPLLVTSSSKQSMLKTELNFKVHCPNREPTCDKASYFTVFVKTSITYDGWTFSPIEKQGIVEADFKKVVTFVPDAVTAPGRPINVVIFLDNSNSMLFAKDQIKDSIDNLVKRLGDMDATVAIFPLQPLVTARYDEYTLDAEGNKVRPILNWSDRPDGYTYYGDVIYEAGYPSVYDPTENPVWNSGMRIFKFRTIDSAAARAQKISGAHRLVDYLFDNMPMGSWDKSFCSIMRFVESPGLNPAFKLDPLTPTVFFVISNEDDETSFKSASNLDRGCLKGISSKYTTQVFNRPEGYYFTAKYQAFSFTGKASLTVDGAPYGNWTFGGSEMMPVYNPSYPYTATESQNCMNYIESLSTAAKERLVRQRLSDGMNYTSGDPLVFTSCTVYYGNWRMSSPSATSDPSLCAQLDAQSPPPLPGWVPGTCSERIQQATTFRSGSEDRVPLYYTDLDNTVDGLYQSLKSKMDLNNLFYIPIIHPDATTCTMTPGAQVGAKYLALGQKPGMKMSLIPVCSSDYTTGLQQLETWAGTLGADDIALPPLVAANMNAVEIVRGSEIIKLIEGVDWKLSGEVLVFRTGLLQPNDVVRVYLN